MFQVTDKLEFEKIKEKLISYTATPLGYQYAREVQPLSHPGGIEELQKESSEAVKIIRSNRIRMEPCQDMFVFLKRAQKGSLLAPEEIRAIGDFLKAVNTIKPAFIKEEGVEELFPYLFAKVSELVEQKQVVSEIDLAVNPYGEIKEQASPALSSLKKQERILQEKIRKTMDSYIQSPHYEKYLQDRIVTVRQNRYVLPLKQECRQSIPGVVHDQSSSGMTLFVEPFPVLELNNKLRELQAKIEEEIERILRDLTLLINACSVEIEKNYYIYGDLDLILARGHLSWSYRGVEPAIDRSGAIDIRQGRHPLIPENEIVPIDVHIGEDFTTLVITGPNTGGKTVTLKTIGLFALMAQSGLHLPADTGTKMGVYKAVWADIGDEQNIEQSLSTFSGHMSNIIRIINALQEQEGPSLILLDELGAGTDPLEGSALAMAILDHLLLYDTRTIATTHINDLKVYAHTQEGMENASMEFDPHSLTPTFRLLIGIPGQSNALVIAEKLGLPEKLVEKARSYMKKEFLDLEEAVSGLMEERKKLSADSRSVEEKKRELEIRLEEIEKELLEIKDKKKQYLSKARDEARKIVSEARKDASEAISRIQEAEKEQGKKATIYTAEQSRKQLSEMHEQLVTEAEQESVNSSGLIEAQVSELSQGDRIYIISLRTYGDIIRIQSESDIQVQVGSLKITTTIRDLAIDTSNDKTIAEKKHTHDHEAKSTAKPAGEGALLWQKSATTKPRIDLRGLTLEDALPQLEKYLDDSLLAGLDSVEIIHGKGTGRLRKGIQEYLDGWSSIENYRLGEENEGGSGVTVVNFRKVLPGK